MSTIYLAGDQEQQIVHRTCSIGRWSSITVLLTNTVCMCGCSLHANRAGCVLQYDTNMSHMTSNLQATFYDVMSLGGQWGSIALLLDGAANTQYPSDTVVVLCCPIRCLWLLFTACVICPWLSYCCYCWSLEWRHALGGSGYCHLGLRV